MVIDFRKRGRERETSTCKRNIDWLPPICATTGDETCKVGMCLDWNECVTLLVCRTMLQPTEPSAQNNNTDLLSYSLGDQKSKIFTGLKSRCQQGWFLLEALGKNLCPCLFQAPEATHIPWLVTPLYHIQKQQCCIFLTLFL